MERSGWDDDDDGFVPPPSQRAWRHPSELGNHAFTPPPARRHGRTQLALAVAAGAIGSLAIATLAVVVTGASTRSATARVEGVDPAGRLASAGAELSSLLSTTVTDVASTAASTPDTTPAVDLTTTMAPVSVPSVVGLRRPDAADGAEIAAVVVDDTTLLAEPEDVADVARFEAHLADGSMVSVMVEGRDPETGLVRLRTRGALTTTGSDSGTWLGVRCSDEAMPTTDDPAPTSSAAAPGATLGSLATAAATTTATVTSVVSAIASSTLATGAARPTTATATGAFATTAQPVAGRTTVATSAPASSSASSPPKAAVPVVATQTPTAPTSTEAGRTPNDPAEPTPVASTVPTPNDATTLAASHRVVHVRDVVEGSPAALSGVHAGDLIVSIDGRPVRSMWSLVLAVRRHTIGDTITIDVVRGASPIELTVVLARHPGTGT